jgi:hypothetical protein
MTGLPKRVSLLINAHPDIIRMYLERYSEIVRGALLRRSWLSSLNVAKLRRAKDWAQKSDSQVLNRWANRCFERLESSKPSSDLQTLGARIAPLPNHPRFFTKTISEPAHEKIRSELKYDSLHGLIENIFEHSEFTSGDNRYRTDWKNDRPVIFGESAANWKSLSAVVHELGHCVAETYSPANSFRRQILSEAFAQTLEERLISVWLQDATDKQEWFNYQRSIDHLNFYFALFELHLAGVSVRFPEHWPKDYFDPHLLFFRETLFTSTGYQLIYAAASLIRESVLRHLPPKLTGNPASLASRRYGTFGMGQKEDSLGVEEAEFCHLSNPSIFDCFLGQGSEHRFLFLRKANKCLKVVPSQYPPINWALTRPSLHELLP